MKNIFFGDFLLYLTYNKVIIKNDILTDKFIEIKDYLYERLTTYEYRFNSESFRNSFKNDVKYSIKREFNLEFEIICDNSNNIDSRIAEPEKNPLNSKFLFDNNVIFDISIFKRSFYYKDLSQVIEKEIRKRKITKIK